jgi:hypothetical protein
VRIFGAVLVGISFFGWGAETVNFDSFKVGEPPPGWTEAMTNTGRPPRWVVHPDASAPSRPNVLAQLSTDRTPYRFPICVYDKIVCRNGDLSVKFKLISGHTEQSAGLVWRYQDHNNYYVVRVNAVADSIVLSKVERGNSQPISLTGVGPKTFGVRHNIELHEWNILRVVFRDDRIMVYFDHRKIFEARDKTFMLAGKTGVWTKGDTIAYFDDFRIDKKN